MKLMRDHGRYNAGMPSHQSSSEHVAQRHPRALGGDTARGRLSEAIFSLSDRVLSNAKAQTMMIGRKPSWIRAKAPGGETYLATKS
ncbi:MAG: hypothetical protein QGH33_04005, partial [Pirellulaceae bacterium]|nr:hypothetical protein [Pirellulaceae bacterium]